LSVTKIDDAQVRRDSGRVLNLLHLLFPARVAVGAFAILVVLVILVLATNPTTVPGD
jgi:hypothetical protein